MGQHPGLMNARDLFGKLEREMLRLEAAASATPAADRAELSDSYFNFAVTAHHLGDWIRGDPSVPAAARTALDDLSSKQALRVCRDLANGSKHFRDSRQDVIVADATCTTTWGGGRYGVGPHGVGEPTILVTLADGTVLSGLELAREATRVWKEFFAAHGL